MTRGQGLENTIKYAWAKQPNERYTIFDVPIFASFQDEKRGQVTQQELIDVVRNFEHDKAENYCYPRIHIGHHDGNQNQPGAGYMDNLTLKGNTIYADLVEVLPEVFQAIRAKLKYPGRSAEYNPEKKKILSLALLESQSSYFSFPLLDLEESENFTNQFNFNFPALFLQEEAEPIEHFQDAQAEWACRWQMIQKFQENFQEGCGCMDPNKEKDDTNDTNPSSQEKEPMVEKAPAEYKCQDDMGGLKDMMTRSLALQEDIQQKIAQIYEWEKTEHENMGDGLDNLGIENDEGNPDFSNNGESDSPVQSEPSKPMEGVKNPMKKPSSVPYQSEQIIAKAVGTINKAVMTLADRQEKFEQEIRQKFSSLDAQQSYSLEEKALQRFCDEQGLNFQEQSLIFKKFSSSADRKAYMDAITKVGTQMPRHPASRVTQMNFSTDENKLLQQYQQDPAAHQRACKALSYYQKVVGTATVDELRQFQSIWTKKPDMMVRYCAENDGAIEDIMGK